MKRTPCQGHRIRSAKLPFQGSRGFRKARTTLTLPVGEGNSPAHGLQKLIGSLVRPFSLSGRPTSPPNTKALQRRLCGYRGSSTIGPKMRGSVKARPPEAPARLSFQNAALPVF